MNFEVEEEVDQEEANLEEIDLEMNQKEEIGGIGKIRRVIGEE
ncbi:17943_t:CDS:2 [Funneliformis caledonium]|uniref:17943_t:CDS:1 n=1 Tax=Funneliformis caledonium TaxID=1117310 RepID=A0A9N9FSI8_9GLOM|nr:17943_t:CDS:2 [Funneliformis caledonium]